MVLYVYNTTIATPNYSPATIRMIRVSTEHAKELFFDRRTGRKAEFVSAIGHQSAATVISRLLGVDIPANRIEAKQENGDSVLAFKLKTRIPEGTILSVEQMQALDYEFWLMYFS